MGTSAKPNRLLFDLDLLRVMVTVADSGSFTAAAAGLHSTQSTISQKVRRLEEMAGHRLLERGNREIGPTDAGAALLGYARRMLALNDGLLEALAGPELALSIRLGVPDDFVTPRMTATLAAFSRRYSQVKLEVTSGLSRDLIAGYDHGELDLILVKQRRHSRAGVACRPEPLLWLDSAANPAWQQDPLPLVAFPPRGLYRDDMITTVEQAGRRWRISFTCSSLSGIQGAVADGLGITLLPARARTPAHRVLTEEDGFASVDTMEVVILHRPTADPLVQALARQLAGLLDDAG